MKKYQLFILILMAVFVQQELHAQSQFSGWLASFNTLRVGKKTSIHTDIQLRSTDELKHVQSLLIRSGLNVHINKKVTLTAGYAFIHSLRNVSGITGYAPEHRAWEQFIYAHSIRSLSVIHRLRVEQRFISKRIAINNELTHDGYDYSNRFRYFVRGLLPLEKQSGKFTKGIFAALQNEVFLNFGNKDAVNGKTFDQNRLYLAMGYRFSKSIDLDLGYMNQYINGRGTVFTNNHIIQLATYLRL